MISLDSLPLVPMVANPGPIVPMSDGRLLVHDRSTQNWVLSESVGRRKQDYGLIEKACDYIKLTLDFGLGSLARSLVYRKSKV